MGLRMRPELHARAAHERPAGRLVALEDREADQERGREQAREGAGGRRWQPHHATLRRASFRTRSSKLGFVR